MTSSMVATLPRRRNGRTYAGFTPCIQDPMPESPFQMVATRDLRRGMRCSDGGNIRMVDGFVVEFDNHDKLVPFAELPVGQGHIVAIRVIWRYQKNGGRVENERLRGPDEQHVVIAT